MNIEIKKKTEYYCEYRILRNNKIDELFTLETKTYFLHDICHFVVEKKLNYSKGFWGMLSLGHSFNELFGKDNAQTEELRFIEQIVGPVQSVYSGHLPEQNFEEHIRHLDFEVPDDFLTNCLTEIKAITEKWRHLPVGEKLILEWKL